MAADHDLLFGLLALQNGLIDQVRLVAAFQAWTCNKAKSLADHLVARGDLDADQRAVVEAMLGLHLKKRGGSALKSLAAVNAGRSTCESLAQLGDPDIEGTLAHVGAGPATSLADRTESYAIGTATSDGLRFRVLRPHARGGLGAIFVALDSELNREVALKQILDRHADDSVSRQRFMMEAEITGGLEHPGIVPVYGMGTYADGRPYYAMRFVKGDSLKEAIEHFHGDDSLKHDPGRHSLELRKLLRRFTDVCNAIDYAHGRGILHRDIKPGNIIVGKHGETLVIDWGLAKPLGHAEPGSDAGERTLMPSSASGSAETLPGSAMGTPAYMSPEQARGDLERLGPRSDVYSLGATLYCLLTARPPFEGHDLGEVLRKVQRGEFARPRQLNSSIDPALEAVCLKAMALKLGDRYSSCRALAEDVDRWMADEPVTAWSEPWTRSLARWLTRHRVGVTAAAAAGIVALVGFATVAAVQAQGRAVLEIKNRQLADASAMVQARYDLAVDAIKTFHTGVSEDFLLKQDQFKELRDRLLNSASGYYEKLGALLKDADDAASRRALLQANFEVAALADKVGRREKALELHRRVLAGREALAVSVRADQALAVDLGRSHLAVGAALESTGQTDDALAAYARARQVVAATDGDPPKGPHARSVFADAEFRAGWLLWAASRMAEALRAAERARDLQAALAAASPSDNDRQSALARSHNLIGLVLRDTAKPSEALAAIEAARAIRERLAAANPDDTQYQVELANSQANIGALLQHTRPAEATSAFEAARATRRRLADDHPAVTQFQNDLANSLHDIGWDMLLRNRETESLPVFQEATVVRRKLAEDNPAVTQFQSGLAAAREALGHALSIAGKRAEARAEYRWALVIRQTLADDHPDIPRFQSDLAACFISLATLLSDDGRLAEARTEFRRALSIRRKLAEDHPDVTEFPERLATDHENFGDFLEHDGKPSEALAEYEAALAIGRKLAADHPDDLRLQSWQARSHSLIGRLLARQGKPSAAEAECLKALAILRKLADTNPKVPYYRISVSTCLGFLSDQLRRLGRLAEARDHAERSIALCEALVQEGPGNPMYRLSLGWSLRRHAMVLLALNDPSGGAADARRALGLYDVLSTQPGDVCFEAACCHAALAGLAGQPGSRLTAAEASTEADAAMALLHKAVGLGYRTLTDYRTDDGLDPLRGREDFRLLLLDLAFPHEPFARPR